MIKSTQRLLSLRQQMRKCTNKEDRYLISLDIDLEIEMIESRDRKNKRRIR